MGEHAKPELQRNMTRIKAQWAVAQIVRHESHDMVESIVKWLDHELYCILGFLACSLGTHTVKRRKTDGPCGHIQTMENHPKV
jgi:hypothetical protein